MQRNTSLLLLGMFLSNTCAAIPFGSFDARTLAMGGTAVASAKNPLGCYYNPALLATYSEYKESPERTSRLMFPTISARYSTSIEDTINIADQDLDGQLRTSINTYNAAQTTSNAQGVVDSAQTLLSALNNIANQSMRADANVGLTLSIPSKKQGGAFCMNVRAVGGGTLSVPQADLQLVDRYVQALTYVATSGTSGTADPTLFTGGNINDFTGNLTSSASARGLIILQTALAMSGEFTFFREKIALGITPKFQRFSTFDSTVQVNQAKVSASKNPNDMWHINMDAGAYMELNEHWRTGLSIKNIIPRTLKTRQNNEIKIEPQIRMGFAYQHIDWLAALDFDVIANAPFGNEDDTRFANIGFEWQAWGALKLRTGYSINLADKDSTGLVTGGVGYQTKYFDFEVAYGESSIEKAASLQFSYLF